MVHSNPFGPRATADQVLAGIDLTGRRFLVTGCNSGLGFQTMSSLAANGAHVIGLARSAAAAQSACERVGPSCSPVVCDLSDLESVTAAVASIRALDVPLDALIANAGIARLPTLQTRYGVELQFLVNHLGHFALIDGLSDLLRDGTGRIVVVGAGPSIPTPAEGIMFDNLDGHRFYRPEVFYGQSKLAAALCAQAFSRRLAGRGITVNAVDPGATRGTGIGRYAGRPPLRSIARLFMRSAQRGAATQALLAASPHVAGISGAFWADCRIVDGPPLLHDAALAGRLWELSERLVSAFTRGKAERLQAAA